MTKTKTKFNQGQILLWSAIIVGAPRWSGAMLAADVGEIGPGLSQFLNIANLISGIAMGPLEVLGIAFILNGLRKTKPYTKNQHKKIYNWKWFVTAVFGVGLLALTPMILTPYIVSQINEAGIADTLSKNLQFFWAFNVTVAPLLIVGGVAFVESGLVSAETAKPAETVSQDFGGSAKAAKTRPQEKIYSCESCEFSSTNPKSYNAHKRHCKNPAPRPSVSPPASNGNKARGGVGEVKKRAR